MNKRIGNLVTFIALSSALAITFGFILNEPNESIIKTNANEDIYNLSIASPDQSEGVYTALTTNGNDIDFAYSGHASLSNKWGSLANNGYLSNTTKISGLKSITVNITTTSLDLKIEYGWTSGTYVQEGTINSSNRTYYFNNDYPSFFKISNTSGKTASITSISLTYSCSETMLPDQYKVLYTLSNNTYSVSGFVSGIQNATIPEYHKGLPVVAIDNRAFNECSTLQTVIISEGITSIGNYAFYRCTNLTTISIPNSISFVGDNAFLSCSRLSYNSYSNCSYLGNSTKPYLVLVSGSKSKTSVTIHSNCVVIYDGAFRASSLTSVDIPSSVKYIGEYAYYESSSITSVIVPFLGDGTSSYTNFGYIFGAGIVQSDQSKYVPESLETVTIRSGIDTIKNSAFADCNHIQTVNIPSSVHTIESDAFLRCSALTTMVVPTSVNEIGFGAFRYCTALETITLPYIGETSPEEYNYNNYLGYIFGVELSAGGGLSNILQYVATDLRNVIVSHGCTALPTRAFYYCSALASITIPSSLTTIANDAFYQCSSVTTLIYTGTVSQWNSITKEKYWKEGCNITTVQCNNGSVSV